MEYYLAINQNNKLLMAATWIHFKVIIMSEKRQTKKSIIVIPKNNLFCDSILVIAYG